MSKELNNANMEELNVGGQGNAYNFSAVRIDNLGATEYTLATIILDISGSVDAFANDILESLKSIISACKKSPRAENLMIRVLEFNRDLNEIHGFKLLNSIDINDYNVPYCTGGTALFDASFNGIAATLTYSKQLIDQDYNTNGIVFIITDGDDNSSSTTQKMILDKMDNAKQAEEIESLLTILIGVNTGNAHIQKYLERFAKEAGLSAYTNFGDATPAHLAKLATFVSKSISSQSQALGSGGASQILTI